MTQREAYQQKLQAKLSGWRAEIEKLRARAAEAQADAQIEYHHDLETLSRQQKQVEEKLAALKEAGDESWEAARASVDNVANALTQEFERFKAKLQQAGQKVTG